MANKTYSVTEARQPLAQLIRSAERDRAVEITRRGEPVAVLLSAREYLAFTGESAPLIQALTRLRERLGLEDLGIGDAEFEGLRDKPPGRAVAP